MYETERERGGQRERERESVCVCVCVCVLSMSYNIFGVYMNANFHSKVCVQEKEREDPFSSFPIG